MWNRITTKICDIFRIITLKQQKFSQSDPVLIRQFWKKIAVRSSPVRQKLASVLIQSDPVLSGKNWLQSWSSPIQSWSVLISGTEANFGRIRTGSDCNFFENWWNRTGSDWQIFSCIYVITLNTSKILVVIWFYRFAKWECILSWMTKALLRQFCNSNCIHVCEYITLSSSSNVNIVAWLVSIPAVPVFVDSALTVCVVFV